MTRALPASVSVCAGAASLFFAWYTIRLVWVNLTVAAAAEHRQAGMYVGAVAFPVATVLFGYASWRAFKYARRRS